MPRCPLPRSTRAPRLMLALLLPATLAMAQSPQANITGTVRDGQGALIVDAEVVAVSVATGQRTQTRSNETGLYALRSLPIGAYSLTAEKPGFRRAVRSGVVLTTGQSLELDVTLEVGAVTEAVTVAASAPLLETRTSDVAQLVESKTVEDIPLGDRRTMNIINTTGAAVFVNYESGTKPNFSLAGGRTQSQMFWIDGGSGQNMRLGIGQIDVDPPVETTQEVKVLSNNYSAEYGGSAGGVIIATTKSGTNRLRGSLFEYLRNEKLDARNFFAATRPPLRYNVFGGTVGGPVVLPKLYNGRDRTFFFFAYEGARRRDGFTRTLTVPTLPQRQGDFSQTLDQAGRLVPVYDPDSTRVENGRTVRTQFAGNAIPASRIDPVGQRLLAFYPLPNRPADNVSGANNFVANYVRLLDRDNYTAKLDHSIGDADRLTFRYNYNADTTDNTSVFPVKAADTLNGQDAWNQFFYGAWTRIVSASMVNDLRVNVGDRFADSRSPGLGGDWATELGLRGVPNGAFPQIATPGFTGLGTGMHQRLSTPIRQYQLVNNLSWVAGRHSWKFGAEARQSYIQDVLRASIAGSFTFSPLATGQPGVASSGNGLASLLVGFPTAFSTRETEPLQRESWYLAGFAQDDWTVTRSLTLNLGVRWETDTPITDRNQRMNGFDQNATNPVSGTPGAVRFMGVDGFRTQPYGTDWNNLAPRFGFAWRPFRAGNTVVRGGYGMFFAHPFDAGAPNSASLGFETSAALNSPDNGVTAPFRLRDGVPLNPVAPQLTDSFGAVRVGQQPTTSVTFYETNRRTGYAHQFNLGVQRELPGSLLVEASYLANLGRKLSSANLSLNQVRPELLRPGVSQRDRPFPQFSNVLVALPSLGVTSYHAGLLRVERRFSAGLSLVGTYTYSKFLNNTTEGGSALGDDGSPYSDLYNRRADWGPSDNDIRHRFTYSGVYELPFGRGRARLTRHPLRHLLGGWGVGSVVTLQSGAPFTVTTRVNTTNAFSAGSLRADVLRDPTLPADQRSLARWFDADAFAQPAIYAFGNQGVNILRGDGLVNFDLSALRNFALNDEDRLQFRAEMFNAFNHPNFGLPGRVFDAPGFGVVSSAGPGRRVQLGLRLVF